MQASEKLHKTGLMHRSKRSMRAGKIQDRVPTISVNLVYSMFSATWPYAPGGMKRQITSISPESCRRIQTCMRLSFDSRTGKSCRTVALPCFDVTISCGAPPPAGTCRVMASTGAQSMSLQHSFGYQSCAFAGTKAAVPARTDRATRAERMVFMRVPQISLDAGAVDKAGPSWSRNKLRA